MIGEHGDSEVPLWSRVVVAGSGLVDGGWEGSRTLADPELQELFHSEVRQAAYEIIRLKGRTSWAIGLATAEIVEAVLRSKDQMLTVSSRSHDHYGLPDVCLSLPTIVNDSGAAGLVQMALSEKEMGQLRHSAKVLRGCWMRWGSEGMDGGAMGQKRPKKGALGRPRRHRGTRGLR